MYKRLKINKRLLVIFLIYYIRLFSSRKNKKINNIFINIIINL